MTDDELHPSIRQARDEMIAEGGPILGLQRARLGADRFAHFTQGHAEVQAMALFLIMSVNIVPQVGYTDEALAALKQDAADVRAAANRWAKTCEELADYWRAQREEQQP